MDPCTSTSLPPDVIIMDLDGNFTDVPTTSNVIPQTDGEVTQRFLNGEISFNDYKSHIKDENSDPDDDLEDELTSNSRNLYQFQPISMSPPKQKEKKPPKVRKSALHPALKGLMGEANLRYARGEIDIAEKMCLEVIRQVPTAPEPFLTLAQIYETDNPEKSNQFMLIAAYLQPYEFEQWIRLAQAAEAQNDIKQAIDCYSKALDVNSSLVEVHFKKIELIEKTGEKKYALRSYMKLLNSLNPDTHADMILNVGKKVAEQYHSENDIPRAISAMNIVFKKCAHMLKPEHINIMLELLITQNDLSYCIDILIQHCNISIEMELMDHELKEPTPNVIDTNVCKIISYVLPPDILIEFRIKFIIVMIRLKAFHLLDQMLEPILAYDSVDSIGDLFLDVVDELIAVSKHLDAIKLLVPLLKNESFSMAAVWLKHADCLKACGMKEQAIESYKEVIRLAPQHVEVRLVLAELLAVTDRRDEALQVLEQDENTELDVGLLLKRASILYEEKQYDEYLNCCLLLLTRHGTVPRNRDEMFTLVKFNMRPNLKSERVKAMREFRGENPTDELPAFSAQKEKTNQEEYEQFKRAANLCIQLKRFPLMQKFSLLALSSSIFFQYVREIELITVWACFFNGDYSIAYNIIREMLQRQMNNPRLWNLFNLIIQRSDDVRHSRFVMRLLSTRIKRKQQSTVDVDPMIHVVHANNCLAAGTYKYALNEYMEYYRISKHPLVALLIAVTMLQIAYQKFTDNKESLLVQAISFLDNYKDLRGPDGLQEVNFNLGRAYQQMGANHLAVHYYKLVLEGHYPLAEKYKEILDLKREAAFNLHLLYKQSGSNDLANMVLMKYITI